MFGTTKDVGGKCNAHLHIADDYGDKSSTKRCRLPPGHDGEHFEEFLSGLSGWVKITWEKDSRPDCCEGYEFSPEYDRNVVDQ